MTTARRLLASIDDLPYGARQRELAARARALAGTAELSGLLDELHAQGRFARTVALHLATVAGDAAYVARCLAAPETDVANRAIGLAVRMRLVPDLLVRRLPELSTDARRTLYRAVRRRKATELAEALLPAVRARFGDTEAAVLLPACGAATVAAELGDLAYAVTGWRMLGHRHPTVFLDWVDAELDATPKAHWSELLRPIGPGLTAAAPTEPARVLAVLTRVTPHASLPYTLDRVWAVLARHDPAGLLAVLLHPRLQGGRTDGRKLWRALLVTSDEDLVRLGRAMRAADLERFLAQLPPPRRPAVYRGVVGDRDHEDPAALDRLPAAARAAEAERLLGLHAVADDPDRRLRVTARLPWPVAKETLREATRRSTAAERAEAYTCLVTAAAGSRDHASFAEMLGWLSRLANEQDPVRSAAFAALAEVPPWLFRPSEAPTLLELMSDATDARDCSWQTQNSVRTVSTNLVRHGTLTTQPRLVDAGIAALGRLGDRRPWLDLSGLDRELPRGGEHGVFEALRPRLTEDARHGRFEVALSLAGGLGRRAWEMPDLQRFVDRARKAADDHTVRTAIGLWLAPYRTRAERVAEVFRADRSTITIHAVLSAIGHTRTDLVDEVLTKSLHGRFLKRGTGHVPRFTGCFRGWLPRQCAAYAALLAEIADGDPRLSWGRVQAVAHLGRVPGTADRLRRYLTDQEVTVVEAALSALAWTDEPADVLDDLLAYADTDRARVAVYAAARSVRFVPPARLGAALERALTSRKVTSRKEAVRLLAEHHAPDVAGLLSAAWRRADQHRDLRRAIVSAARWCLDDERAWSLLAEAARAEHAVATAVLDLSPHTIARHHRPRYAALVHTVADSAEPDIARHGLIGLARWARWDETGTRTLVDRVTDLANTSSWTHALMALVAAVDATEDPAPLVDATTTLLATPEPVASVDRDLPARQRMLAIVSWLRSPPLSPVRRRAAALLADVLAGELTLRHQAIGLAVAAAPLDPDETDTPDEAALLRVAELADEPALAWHAHRSLLEAARGRAKKLPQPYLLDLATALATRDPAPAPQLLALALATVAGAEAGWPPPWRELVGRLRTHPDPNARTAALDLFLSRE